MPIARTLRDDDLGATWDDITPSMTAHQMSLLFPSRAAAIIPRPTRPQSGAPVADGLRAASPQVASRSNADQPAARFFRRTR